MRWLHVTTQASCMRRATSTHMLNKQEQCVGKCLSWKERSADAWFLKLWFENSTVMMINANSRHGCKQLSVIRINIHCSLNGLSGHDNIITINSASVYCATVSVARWLVLWRLYDKALRLSWRPWSVLSGKRDEVRTKGQHQKEWDSEQENKKPH